MIVSESLKVRDLKIGTNNCNRAYIGNDLVYRRGKWVFNKKILFPEYSKWPKSATILEPDDFKSGGIYVLVPRDRHSLVSSITFFNDNNVLFSGEIIYWGSNETYCFKINKINNRYHLSIIIGIFDKRSEVYYNSKVLKECVINGSKRIDALSDNQGGYALIYKYEEV